MVYLLKIVIFHGYVSHNQMVINSQFSTVPKPLSFHSHTGWLKERDSQLQWYHYWVPNQLPNEIPYLGYFKHLHTCFFSPSNSELKHQKCLFFEPWTTLFFFDDKAHFFMFHNGWSTTTRVVRGSVDRARGTSRALPPASVRNRQPFAPRLVGTSDDRDGSTPIPMKSKQPPWNIP